MNIKEDEVKLGVESHGSTASSDESNDDDYEIKKKLSLLRFIKSDNTHIRLLSCLIIIRTLNQVDYLMNVFEILRSDLKDESIKELFYCYYGTWVLLKWCKLATKVKKQNNFS